MEERLGKGEGREGKISLRKRRRNEEIKKEEKETEEKERGAENGDKTDEKRRKRRRKRRTRGKIVGKEGHHVEITRKTLVDDVLLGLFPRASGWV